ncbi:MAG: CRTAC1 family protein, partial [Bacteroidota bacterium]
KGIKMEIRNQKYTFKTLKFRYLNTHSSYTILHLFLILILSSPIFTFAQTTFTDITEQAGIDHEFHVYEGFLGGGACVLDFNNDGFQDVYLTGGMNEDRLYLNKGNGTFEDVLESAGLTMTKEFVTQGVAAADVNRDGWVDLFITTNKLMDSTQVIPRAQNLLFLNNGNETFRDATADFRLDQMNSFSTGICFGDFNADGYPDAYVGNYFHDYTGPLKEINDATIVNANNTAKGYLLLNVRGKYFKNVYADYGLTHKGFGFGGLFTDFDNDGDQDLLVNHDFGYKAKPNYLLRNEFPAKKFTYVEKELEMDLRINAMTSAVGDYDNDGWLDYFITNIRFNYFMVNQGADEPFIEKAKELGTRLFKIGWGANFADFDHDSDLDLFVSNGDLNPNCTPFNNFYFKNENYRFTEIAHEVGLKDYGIGRGSVIFDIENDGDMDLLVVNQQAVMEYPVASKTILYRNDLSDGGGHYLKVKLEGKTSTTRGLGARIKVVADSLQMIREIDGGGSSHLSQNTTIAHFGLGAVSAVDSVIVTWVGGKQQVVLSPDVNTLLIIEEAATTVNPWYIFMAILVVVVIFIVWWVGSKRG